MDAFIEASEKAFDCSYDGLSKFYPWQLPEMPKTFKLGVIVGSSGSGKTNLLRQFGNESIMMWARKGSIIGHFKSPEEGMARLGAVGLNSIPTWYKQFRVLSTGEKFRADLARQLESYAVIDEFTSVVDRDVAKATSMSVSRYIKNSDITNVVFATCHRDIVDWLEPSWVIDTDTGEFHDGFFLQGQKYRSKFTEQITKLGTCLKTITI